MSTTMTIRCDEALARLFEYLDHELDAHRHEEMEQHLRTCRTCYSHAEFERRLKAKFADAGKARPDIVFEERIHKLLKNF